MKQGAREEEVGIQLTEEKRLSFRSSYNSRNELLTMGERTKLTDTNSCSSHKGVKRKYDGRSSPPCVFDRVLASKMNSDACGEDGTSVDISDDEHSSEYGNDSLLQKTDLNTFRRSDALENCRKWVNQSQELYPTKSIRTRSYKEERPVTATAEEQDVDSPDGDESDSKASNGKCSMLIKGKRLWLKEQVLHLVCEWKNCSYESDDVETFVRHVSMHIPDLDIRVNEDGKEVFVCLWALCDFETEEPKEIVRHVNFHSYHTKLKSIGAMLMKHFKALICTYDGEGRNTIPDVGEEYICYWADCERAFNNMQIFLYHVQSHVQCNPRGRVVKGGVPCQWEDCSGVFVSVYKLSEHVRTHTQEKIVGCPTCGATYASRTKFLDHCKRQVSVQAGEGYKCTHCNKIYPSERLFHEHVRLRVNLYKCRFCDMTCPTPSALVVHMRFRHLDERLFKCAYCDYRAKTLSIIRGHMNTHFSGNLYHCSVEGCNFSCRSRVGMKKHIARVHEGQHEPLYCCHLCDRRFQRGASLTKHVFREHDLRWPSGHKRFRYHQHEDGLYRLQLVRYESLEVTQMISGDSSHDEQHMNLSNKKYHLRRLPSRTRNEPAAFEVYEEVDENDFKENSTGGNKVLITISDVDHSGNVIQSEVIEAEELTMLPSMTLLDDTN